MPTYKKLLTLLMMAALIFLVMADSHSTYANENYPLESEEILLEERTIDDTHTDIFTQSGDRYFLKNLEKDRGFWDVIGTQTIQLRRTGLRVDKTARPSDKGRADNIQGSNKGLGMESPPSVVDYSNSPFLPPVGDQGSDPTCVGWAAGYYLRTYQEAKDIGWIVKTFDTGISGRIFSPSFIYNQIPKDEFGYVYIDDACNLLKNEGAATLDIFPYISGNFNIQPDQAVRNSALQHRISDWRVLYTGADSDNYILLKAKEYLYSEGPLVVGNNIGFNFYSPVYENGNSVVISDYTLLGAHAFVLVGYDDNFTTREGKGAFKLVNSWGENWGDQGYAYITYKAFVTNAVVGYGMTDLENTYHNNLDVNITNPAVFDINFAGTGKYDMKILDMNDELVYEATDIHGEPGINKLTWDGKDRFGNSAAEGQYKLSIVTYKNGTPKDPINILFDSGKVQSAHSSYCTYDNEIQHVDIITNIRSSGLLNIKINCNGAVYPVITDEAVIADESKVYTIGKDKFNFNGRDLNQVQLQIEVR